MKILYVSGPSLGGIARHMELLAKGMAAQGIKVEIADPVRPTPGRVINLASKLRRGEFKLVHCHGFQGSAVGRAAAGMTGLPAVVTIHNTLQVKGVVNQLTRVAEGWLRKPTCRWVTVSHYLQHYAWNVLAVPSERTQVIANGIPVPDRLPPWFQRPVVGTVARLIPSKGVDIFLRAVQLLRPEVPGLKAVILGDGPAKYKLQALSRSLGLEDVVTFYGHCQDVPSHLRKMGVFVLPTRSEGLGISVLEAMASGVPVVATAVGGVPELVKHDKTGLLVRKDDSRAIANSVRQLFNDSARAESLRQGAYRHLTQNYSIQDMVNRTLQMYRRVLDA